MEKGSTSDGETGWKRSKKGERKEDDGSRKVEEN